MINWYSLFTASIWVSGLALILATFSYASYRASVSEARLRLVLFAPNTQFTIFLGLTLFALGMGLGAFSRRWEFFLWLALAASFAFQTWGARRRAHPAVGAKKFGLAGRHILVVGLVALGALLASLYGVVIRPWMQPDEPRHMEVAMHVVRLGKPVLTSRDRVPEWEQEIIVDMEAQSFWWYGFSLIGWDPNNLPQSFAEIWGPMYSTAFFQPPLYYDMAAVALWFLGPDASLSASVIWIRLLGALLLAFSLVGVYLIARELFPNRSRLALAALSLAALWPSHLAANAAVNNDPLVEAFTVWTLYCAVRLIRRGPTLGLFSALITLSLLAVASKRTGLVSLVIVSLALLLWAVGALRHPQSRHQRWWGWVVLAGSLVLAAILALAAARTGRLGIPQTFVESLLSGAYTQQLMEAPIDDFASAIFRTLIGWFGWMRVPLAEPIYWLGLALLLLSLFGPLLGPQRRELWRMEPWQYRVLLLFFLAFLTQLFLIAGKELVYGTWRDGSLPQARYLYPILPALILPFLLGLSAWIPRRLRSRALLSGLVVLFVFNIYVLGFVLYPFFWL
ncbi:MAG: hypothetical protein GXP42_08700 [Chloroflexi bacterium]|nr:hypothetical protein [Chloroflexota bacterium]